MASTDKTSNGQRQAPARGERRQRSRLNLTLLRDEAGHISEAASNIARTTEAVSEGAESQLASLDDAVANASQVTASLAESARQAESVGLVGRALASSINEMAASIEQVTTNTGSLASAVRESASGDPGDRGVDPARGAHRHRHGDLGRGGHHLDGRDGGLDQARDRRTARRWRRA